mgnify:CR=1 FL=1|tara:strand:+ start:41740 stop:42120 length:381 start_codon:yes stop_codon:yes gene_type:complete
MNLIYITLIVYFSALIDANHLLLKHWIFTHVPRWVLRATVIVAISTTVVELAGYALFFMATFDQCLNKMRGIDLMYLGDTAYWDKFFNKRPILYIRVKVVGISLGIYFLTSEMHVPSLFLDALKYI